MSTAGPHGPHGPDVVACDEPIRHRAAMGDTPADEILASVEGATSGNGFDDIIAKFDPHTTRDLTITRAKRKPTSVIRPRRTLSHAEMEASITIVDDAIDLVVGGSSPDADALGRAILKSADVIGHMATTINDLVLRVSSLSSDNVRLSKDTKIADDLAANAIEQIRDERDLLSARLESAGRRVSVLEDECDKYAVVLQQIEEYDPDWMTKVLTKAKPMRLSHDDGLDMLVDLIGLVKND